MQIREKHNREVQKIMAETQCPRDFACYKSGFEDLCEAKDAGLDGFAYCLEEVPFAGWCKFSLSFGKRQLCRCRLRIYIARNLCV